MALTAGALAEGFNLTTFATGFQTEGSSTGTIGPLGIAFPNSGTVLGGFGLNPVPEPASVTLLSVGLASLAAYGWRRRKRAA